MCFLMLMKKQREGSNIIIFAHGSPQGSFFEKADKACCIMYTLSLVLIFKTGNARGTQVRLVGLTLITDVCAVWISQHTKGIPLLY